MLSYLSRGGVYLRLGALRPLAFACAFGLVGDASYFARALADAVVVPAPQKPNPVPWTSPGPQTQSPQTWSSCRGNDLEIQDCLQSSIDAATELFKRGNAYWIKGNLDSAFANYNQAIQTYPEFGEAFDGRGNVYWAKGDFDHALADYNKAIQLIPNYAGAYYGRGNVYFKRGDLDHAFADYNQTIRLDPGFVSSYYGRGNVYRARGDLDHALADYNQAIQLNSKFAEAFYGRAVVYRLKGNLNAAFNDYNRSIQLNSKIAQFYYGRGELYRLRGDLDHAFADYNQAIQPNSQTMWQEADAATSVELENRIASWKRRPRLYCTESTPNFPSKWLRDPKSNVWGCDDGDMTLFNGLLCMAGEIDGCTAVQDAQDKNSGIWWRSPKKIGHPDPTGAQPTFNSDQSLGIFAYLTQSGDATAFHNWLTWVAGNPNCASTNGECGWIGMPRVCTTTGDCSLRPVDCALIILFGELLAEQTLAMKVCSPLKWLPTPEEVQQKLAQEAKKAIQPLVDSCENARNSLLADARRVLIDIDALVPTCNPISLPVDLLNDGAAIGQKYGEKLRNVIATLMDPVAGSALAFQNAVTVAVANAQVNDIGQVANDISKKPDDDAKLAQGRHLAATELLILSNFVPYDPQLRGAANILSTNPHAKENPFFKFLSEGPRSPKVLQLIIDKCPDTSFDLANAIDPDQWSWERADDEQPPPWLKSMYWDCIFVANLWKNGVAPLQRWANYKFELPHIDVQGFNPLPTAQSVQADIEKFAADERKRANDLAQSILATLDQLRRESGIDSALSELARKAHEVCEQNQPPPPLPRRPCP